jgi:hypothetical protein
VRLFVAWCGVVLSTSRPLMAHGLGACHRRPSIPCAIPCPTPSLRVVVTCVCARLVLCAAVAATVLLVVVALVTKPFPTPRVRTLAIMAYGCAAVTVLSLCVVEGTLVSKSAS